MWAGQTGPANLQDRLCGDLKVRCISLSLSLYIYIYMYIYIALGSMSTCRVAPCCSFDVLLLSVGWLAVHFEGQWTRRQVLKVCVSQCSGEQSEVY